MKIITSHVKPPIPTTRFDWLAVDDETYDGPGSAIGVGATEREAIDDLLEQVCTPVRDAEPITPSMKAKCEGEVEQEAQLLRRGPPDNQDCRETRSHK